MMRKSLPAIAEIEDLLRQFPPQSIAPLPPATLRDLFHISGFVRVAAIIATAAILTGLFCLSLLPPSALAIAFTEPVHDTLTRDDRLSFASQYPAALRPADPYCRVALSDLMQAVDRVERFEMRRSISDIPIVASSQMIPDMPRAKKPRHRARRTVHPKQPPAVQADASSALFMEKLFGWIMPKNPGSNGG